MSLTRTLTTIGVALALGLPAVPAEAQHRSSGGQAAGRAAPRGAPQQAAPPPAGARGGAGGQVYGRPPAAQGSRPVYGPPAGGTRPVYGPSHNPGPGGAVPRSFAPYGSPYYSRYYPARGYSPRYYGAPYYGRPYYYRAPVYYGRPYYAFRPWFNVGFGVSIGYPVAYPVYGYGYQYPYPYPYSSAVPYPVPYPVPYSVPSYPTSTYPASGYPASGYPAQAPQNSVAVAPGQATYGGVSFDITPSDAEIYVDGTYMGRVADFSPSSQPLTLNPGVHRVEVRAPGYQSLAYDVTIAAGQVVPFQGTLQR